MNQLQFSFCRHINICARYREVECCIMFCRSRPIVNASATLLVYPIMINPEEKTCSISSGNQTSHVSWYVLLFYCNFLLPYVCAKVFEWQGQSAFAVRCELIHWNFTMHFLIFTYRWYYHLRGFCLWWKTTEF